MTFIGDQSRKVTTVRVCYSFYLTTVSGVTCDYPGKNGTKEPLAALKEYFLRFSDEIESLLLLIGFTHVEVAVEGVS